MRLLNNVNCAEKIFFFLGLKEKDEVVVTDHFGLACCCSYNHHSRDEEKRKLLLSLVQKSWMLGM